jgi:hypothetical protein
VKVWRLVLVVTSPRQRPGVRVRLIREYLHV